MATSKVVLRNINASTEHRYLPADFRGYLVGIGDAKTFSSASAADRFLKENNEFTGFRVERLPK